MTNWWVNDGGLGILPGSSATYGGGGGNVTAAGAVQFRSPIDAARAAAGRLPQAEYPDGYLGNIIDRRSDRLIQAVKERLTDRSYQRGVHKGSRISPKDYLWPDGGVTPDAGLERQAATAMQAGNTQVVARYAPSLDPVERLAHQGRTAGMATPGELDAKMAEARAFGVSPAMNPIVPQDPRLMTGVFIPRYSVGSRSFGSPGRSNT